MARDGRGSRGNGRRSRGDGDRPGAGSESWRDDEPRNTRDRTRRRDFDDLTDRLDSLSSQLDRLSARGRDRSDPPARRPRERSQPAAPMSEAGAIGETLDRLSNRLDDIERSARRGGRDEPAERSVARDVRPARDINPQALDRDIRQRRVARRLDTDMKSAVSDIARRQRELARAPGRTHSERESMRNPRVDIPESIERHFGELADRIESLRDRSEPEALTQLLHEVGALRQEIATQSLDDSRLEDIAHIKETARNIEARLGENSFGPGVEDMRAELSALRDTVVENSADRSVASLRDGYEDILHRLENLQSSVGDPRLYHSIADRLGEVRKALRAIPQVERASDLENRIGALNAGIESLRDRFDGMPFETLQSQILDLHEAVQSISPAKAVSELDWKMRALADKVDALEDGIARSGAVSDRVASLEDLIRSQTGTADVSERIDRLHDLVLEQNSFDAIRDLEERLEAIGERLDFVGSSGDTDALLKAIETRIGDLSDRMETLNGSFDSFAETRSEQSLAPQLETMTARIEMLADAILKGRISEPVQRDIGDLRRELADGDRAVVDLADRIGRISERLDRFVVFDGEDGNLERLSDDLARLQRQISDGDTVVFEILKRVGNLEAKIDDVQDGAADGDTFAKEISEIRDHLASGDDLLNRIADQMETLVSNVSEVAEAPGLLSELTPVRKDFEALQSELADGNKVARDVIDRLNAIDRKLDTLVVPSADNGDVARLAEEIAALRDVVKSVDNAAINSLHDDIRSLSKQLDRPTSAGSPEQFEEQIGLLASKLSSTEGQLNDLALVTDRLDEIDEKLIKGRMETVSATREILTEIDAVKAGSPGIETDAVDALHEDLKRLQELSAKSDSSFESVKRTLTGISDRLEALETGRLPAAAAPVPTPAPEISQEEKPVPSRPSRPAAPAEPDSDPAAHLSDMLDADEAGERPTEDDQPLEPGSGKPRVIKIKRDEPDADDPSAGPAADTAEPRAAAPNRTEERAQFLADARRAAKMAVADVEAASDAEKAAGKKGWLAKATALRNRGKKQVKPDDTRKEPGLEPEIAKSERLSGLADDALRAFDQRAGDQVAAQAPGGISLKKYTRAALIAGVSIAVVAGGLLVARPYLADNTAFNGSNDTARVAIASADNTGQAASGEPADAASLSADNPDMAIAVAPPSGLESTFDQHNGSGAEPGIPLPADQAEQAADDPEAGEEPRQIPTARAIAPAAPETGLSSPAENAALPDAAPINPVGPPALQSAADEGNAFAQFEIASRYMEGRHVEQDLAKAVEWYAKAAAKDLAPAQYRLGSMYEKGLGVPRDLQAARSWYTRAADKGNAKAIHNLAVLHAEGGLGSRNFDRAAQWFLRSASHGVTDSQYNLGILFAQGLGVERNLLESYKWFSLAARAGDADAEKKRQAVAAELTDEQRNRANIAVTAWKPEPIDPQANRLPDIPAAWKGGGTDSVSTTGSTPVVPRAGQTVLPASSTALNPQDMIAQAQTLLSTLGFDPGPADGKIGPKTREAIKAFQRDTGLPVTGRVSLSLINALKGPAT